MLLSHYERLVQQHQVEVVGLQLAQTLVDTLLGGLVAVVGHPDFADEEDVLARDAALLDGRAHAFLVYNVNHKTLTPADTVISAAPCLTASASSLPVRLFTSRSTSPL